MNKTINLKNRAINIGLLAFAVAAAFLAVYLLLPGIFPFSNSESSAAGSLIGYHDGGSGTVTSSQCNAFGWATDSQNTSQDLRVRVLSDGALVSGTTVIADSPRADLAGVCAGGTCAFNISLDGKITPNQNHAIAVEAQNPADGTWSRIDGSPRTLNCTATPPPDPSTGCIDVIKEAYNTVGTPITPVPQFTFRLNDNEQVKTNDGTGRVRFNNVTPGTNTVREDLPAGWNQTSVTPPGGVVDVPTGSNCAVVIFKNRQTTPVIPRPLNVSCSGSPSFAAPGENVTWTANASNGTGFYTYSWSGTDNLTGSTRVVNKTYQSLGQKFATVTVTSGTETRSATCFVNVGDDNPPPPPPILSGSCSVSPSTINTGGSATWLASATGGDGAYSYSWSGTDGLSGSGESLTRQYLTAGTKTGTVVITSGSQSVTRTCTLSVVLPPQDPSLDAVCSVSPSSIYTGDTATWNVNSTGGNGTYNYAWSGTDGLSGAARTVTRQYTTSGTKFGTITVTSGSQSVSRTCSLAVQDQQQTLNGSCFATPGSGMVGDTIIWTANSSGGDGNYTYQWSGAASGTARTVNNSYGSSGTQTATVTITSAGQSITRSCSVAISQQQQTLNGSCSANPPAANLNQSIAWTAYPSGGTGSYSYSWSGDVSGGNQTVYQSYSVSGNKYANVTITSGGQSITRNCQALVENVSGGNLSVSCSPIYNNQNQNVTWTSSVYGGTGNYNYYWSGTDGLTGNSQNTSMTYTTSGTKYATINVISGGQSASATCQVTIGAGSASGPNVTITSLPLAGVSPLSSFVYLSQLPYTGLLDGGKGGIFTALLVIWSSVISYAFLKYTERKRKFSAAPISVGVTGENISKSSLVAGVLPGIFAPGVSKKGELESTESGEDGDAEIIPEEDEEEIPEEMDAVFESVGAKNRTLFSEKGKRMIIKALSSGEKLEDKLAKVIRKVSLVKPREYGWLSVNKEILSETGFA